MLHQAHQVAESPELAPSFECGATQKRCFVLAYASAAAAAHTRSMRRSQRSTWRSLKWARARTRLPARAPLAPQQAAGEPGALTEAAQSLTRTLRARSQVLASVAQNLGVPTVLVNGDRSPPSPRTRQSRSSVHIEPSQPEITMRRFCVRLLETPGQPGPD